ncbi:hypothetical protein DL98DRAFT_528989 [Cadophora sp. DSE1049]|nr:hypothetical protein DL98DRAFT_528989 [Cadophora sp. DSE1049]
MPELQEHAELAEIGDPREDKGAVEEDATDAPLAETEQAMAILNEDMDSRTSLAGRKRNLQELAHGDKANSDEENDERLRKRVKDHQDPPLVGGLEASITSPPMQVSLPTQVEADTGHRSASEPSVFRLLQEESERSQVAGAESHSLFNVVGKGSEAQDSVPAPMGSTQPVAMPSSSWNGGVSTGLRTSFGGKVRSSFGLRSTTTPAIGFSDTAAPVDPVGADSVTSSVLSTSVNSPIVAPASELNKEGQDDPEGEDKAVHLKSIFAQFREPAPSKLATPSVTRDTDSTGGDSRHAADGSDDLASQNLSTTSQNRHVPFRKLKKAARNNLRPEDRAKYDAAAIAHNAQKREKRERKRGRKAAKQAVSIIGEPEVSTGSRSHEDKSPDQNTTTSDDEGVQSQEQDTAIDTSQAESQQNVLSAPTPFKRLGKKEVSRLSKNDRDEYNRALNAHLVADRIAKNRTKKEARRQRIEEELPIASQQAEAAIQRNYPLSANDAAISDMISRGETFYPKKLEKVPFYHCGVGEWDLHEVFGTDGKPLQIQDFSFNVFAPVFLSRFPKDWYKINRRTLVGAFGNYVPPYYKHVGVESDAFLKCRATATDLSAITVEEAQILADQISRRRPDPSQVSKTLPKASNASISESASAIHEEGDITMNDVETSIAPADDEPFDMDLRQAELYLQQRYYPWSNLNILRCLACSKTGHHTLECPLMKCTICQTSGIHSEAMCPQKKRCDKCRERGHKTEACKEKLSLSKSEMSCDICHSTDHLEMACHYVWRSFDPNPEEILTVQDIPIECYTCGYSGHFGPECGLHRGTVFSGGLTWSKHNLNMYVDLSSANRALSAGRDYSIPAKGPKRGNANDPITIDDESDAEPFIRPKVLPSHPKGGKIQMQPIQQKQQPSQQKNPKGKKNKNKNKQHQPQPQPQTKYHRDLNPPRASRPDFGSDMPLNSLLQNPPSGPRGGGPSNFGNTSQGGRGGGGAGRGGRGGGGGGGPSGPSRAERRRMADQAGARSVPPGGY